MMRRRSTRTPSRGMTLIEVLIVMALFALMSGALIAGSGQLSGSKLKRSSTMLAGAIRVAFSRASSTSKSVRLVFDMENNAFWLEEGDVPMLVQSNDTSGTGGAEATTLLEQQAIADKDRIVQGPRAPRPPFHEVEAPGLSQNGGKPGHRPLESGITFREVQTAHDDSPRSEGRAYLYFWPGGMTERASIQVRIGESEDDHDTLTLVVSPLTGKAQIKEGPIALANPHDDKEASEREDPGAF